MAPTGAVSPSGRLQMGQGALSAPYGRGGQRSFGFVLIGGMQLPKRVSRGSKRDPNLAMMYSNAKATEPSNTSAQAGGWIVASTAASAPMTTTPRIHFLTALMDYPRSATRSFIQCRAMMAWQQDTTPHVSFQSGCIGSPRSKRRYFSAVQSRCSRHISKSASVLFDKKARHAISNAERAASNDTAVPELHSPGRLPG
jgi:hypothetical protein